MQKIYCTINRVGNEAEIMCVVCVYVDGQPVVVMNVHLMLKLSPLTVICYLYRVIFTSTV